MLSQLEVFSNKLYREAFDQLSLQESEVHGVENTWVGEASSGLKGISRMMYTGSWVDEFDAWLRYPHFFRSSQPIHLIRRPKTGVVAETGIIRPLGNEFKTAVLHHPLTRKVQNRSHLQFDQVENYEDFLEMLNLQARSSQNQVAWIDQGEEARFITNPRVKGFIGWYDQIPATTVTLVKHGEVGTIWSLGVQPEMKGEGLEGETIRFALDIMRNWRNGAVSVQEVLLNSSSDEVELYKENGFYDAGSLRNQVVVSSLHSV